MQKPPVSWGCAWTWFSSRAANHHDWHNDWDRCGFRWHDTNYPLAKSM